MPIPVAIAAAAAAAPIIAGAIGAAQASKDLKEQRKLLQQAADEIKKIMPPDPESQKLVYEELAYQGIITPQLEQSFPELTSAVSSISADPMLRQQQGEALASLQRQSTEGLTMADRAALTDMQNQVAAQEKGQRMAVLQNMARRGISGSGMELAATLENQQRAADRAAQQTSDLAAADQQRRWQALQAAGDMASRLENQRFNQDLQRASAQDAIQQFNRANSIGMQQRNLDRSNTAQATNLSARQADVQGRNQMNARNRDLYQTGFENQLRQASAMGSALAGQAASAGQNADRTANRWAQGGTAVGSGLTSYLNYERNKDKEG